MRSAPAVDVIRLHHLRDDPGEKFPEFQRNYLRARSRICSMTSPRQIAQTESKGGAMQTTVALRRPTFSIARLAVITALLVAFFFGSARGHLVEGLTPYATTLTQHTAGLPGGPPPGAWDTAGTRTCVSNP